MIFFLKKVCAYFHFGPRKLIFNQTKNKGASSDATVAY